MTRDHRKIAAILAADVVDYSRLMGADEAGTLAALADCCSASWQAISSQKG